MSENNIISVELAQVVEYLYRIPTQLHQHIIWIR
jgi:translation initiation factor IF-1